VSSFKYLSGLNAIGCDPEGGGVRHDVVHDADSYSLAVLSNFDWGVDEVGPVFLFVGPHVASFTGLVAQASRATKPQLLIEREAVS
jgi:hypothetical protein